MVVSGLSAILASTHSLSLSSRSGYFGSLALIELLLMAVLSEALRIVDIVEERNGSPYLDSNHSRRVLAEHLLCA